MSPRRAAALAIALGLALGAGTAAADGWYFTWHCQGACAAGQASLDGTEGPFASEADCDQAQRARRYELNASPGSAGTASECYSDATGGGTGPTGTIVRSLVLARLYAAALYGTPWSVEYASGTVVDVGPTTGVELALAFGREGVGLQAAVGLLHAPGPREHDGDPADPLWALAFDLGVTSSPFAIVRRPGLELRPDLGVDVGLLQRLSCERCEFSLTRKQEPDSTFLWRVRAGVDVWLGRRRNTGVAVEAMYQHGRMGGDEDLTSPDAAFDVKLTPPTWMLRVSFIRRGSRYAVGP